MSASSLRASDAVTRFILPFHYRESDELVHALEEASDASWVKSEIPAPYLEERIESFWANQFGTRKGSKQADGYMRLAPEAESRYLDSPLTILPRTGSGEFIGTFSLHKRGVELFLPPRTGFGMLSIAADLSDGRPMDCPVDAISEFNYGLAQRLAAKGSVLQRGQADQGEIKNARRKYINDEEFRRPAGERLTRDGGRFTLMELARWLISPILNSPGTWPTGASLQVFTVVRFPQNIQCCSIARPVEVSPHDDLAALAAGLSQIEEKNHPLPVEGEPGIHIRMLSRQHLAAVSTQGSAHLVFDQGIEFDQSRVNYWVDRYFVDWFAASAIRGRLNVLGESARRIALGHEDDPGGAMDMLRRDAAVFLSRADLLEVSTRDAHNRYFALCKEAFDTEPRLQLLQRTIADLDGGILAQQQVRIARAGSETQKKLEWIEVLLIGIYAFDVADKVGERLAFRHEYVVGGALAVLMVSFALALFWVRPFEDEYRPDSPRVQRQRSGRRKGWVVARRVIVVSLMICLYTGVGVWKMREPGDRSLPTEWLDIKRRGADLPTVSDRAVALERKAAATGDGIHALREDERPLSALIQTGDAARMVHEQLDGICGDSCLAARPEVRRLKLAGIQAWQKGDFDGATLNWQRALDSLTIPVRRDTTARGNHLNPP